MRRSVKNQTREHIFTLFENTTAVGVEAVGDRWQRGIRGSGGDGHTMETSAATTAVWTEPTWTNSLLYHLCFRSLPAI